MNSQISKTMAIDPRPFSDEKLQFFSEYLESFRHNGGCARFADLQLMDVYKIAPLIYIFDISHNDGKWILRFFGSGLVTAYGRDLTGEDVHDALRGPHKDELVNAMNTMIADQKPLWTINTVESDVTDEFDQPKLIAYERLAYPLIGKGEQVDHVISIVHFYPSTVDHPFRTSLFD